MKKTYSTLEISRMCHVDPVTIARWCDNGDIKCFRTPGGHRRIMHGDLLEFLKRQKIPLPADVSEGPAKILIVDDDPDFAKTLRVQIAQALPMAEIELAQNGVDALIKIGSELPDVVLLDLLLPRLDGIEVCRRVKANPKTASIRIVAVTASVDRKRSDAAIKAGASACLVKPVRAADLLPHLASIRESADGRR
jgi:CheY-like chemotaxis protein